MSDLQRVTISGAKRLLRATISGAKRLVKECCCNQFPCAICTNIPDQILITFSGVQGCTYQGFFYNPRNGVFCLTRASINGGVGGTPRLNDACIWWVEDDLVRTEISTGHNFSQISYITVEVLSGPLAEIITDNQGGFVARTAGWNCGVSATVSNTLTSCGAGGTQNNSYSGTATIDFTGC